LGGWGCWVKGGSKSQRGVNGGGGSRGGEGEGSRGEGVRGLGDGYQGDRWGRGYEDHIFLEDQFARELTQAGSPPGWKPCGGTLRTYIYCVGYSAAGEITIMQEFVGYNWLAMKFK